jgi:CHAT domain-containing protein
VLKKRNKLLLLAACVALASTVSPARAAAPSLSDSFRLGRGGGVLCRAQAQARDTAFRSIFDRSWDIVCRDAAKPVGKLRALRGTDIEARIAGARTDPVDCDATGTATAVALPRLPGTVRRTCRLRGANVGYATYIYRRGAVTYVSEGFEGYASALELALQTIVADRIVAGKVTIATSAVADQGGFARIQAATLDPVLALAEGYRRNNSGDYAEAAEFFDILQQRVAVGTAGADRSGEYRINRALQRSNLGDFAEADALFAEARALPSTDRVQTRLRRNFEALHLLNQQRYTEALARLDEPVVPLATLPSDTTTVEIGVAIAAEINNGVPVAKRLGATETTSLTPDERAEIIDAQAQQIRGTLLRLTGKPRDAMAALDLAGARAIAVRQGRVLSITRLRAQILAETGLALEELGDSAGGEARLREALALLETRYPQTVALNGARARLAAYLARNGQSAAAMAQFRIVVQTAAAERTPVTGLGNLLNPYFRLLADGVASDATLIDDFFLATQTLVRPGVADTQAILARELSEGSGAGSRLFRQARTLERDIERTRIELANLVALPNANADVRQAIAALTIDLADYATEQTATQNELAAFPQYRALTPNALTLPELRAVLKPGEGYLKLAVAGRDVFAMLATSDAATAWRVPLSRDALDAQVTALRDTIVVNEDGQLNTYPFDIAAAHALYTALAGPTADRLPAISHLIFEPDGAMARLPLDLLVTDMASVDRYRARTADRGADQFDFSGTAWLARTTSISTAVAARAFRDTRTMTASSATAAYLGFGRNAPAPQLIPASATVASGRSTPLDCRWPVAEWNKPVADTELRIAARATGAGDDALTIDAAFTDSAVKARDLSNTRILHFATHGLVTAPREGCPARPALLTSFGPEGSDGLLDFSEIFALKLDADLVILSACDTAGTATIAETRAAGITSGGGNALDGLVRAFIGAGGRSIIASHWPAPDEFKATERLISGLFGAPPGTSVGTSLTAAQRTLMDDKPTSHPYYWSGFALIGDGAQPLVLPR